ncbi:MAG: hypothetical protein ACYTGG_10880 [Planctomycetota bacterium]
MKITILSSAVPAATVAFLLLLPGCIERKESIRVGADGRVEMQVRHDTDSHTEMYLGDAIPAEDRGWIVQAWSDLDAEGKEQFHLRAAATFPAGSILPSNYASVQDPDPGTSLQFPTALLQEERRDGTYYHFRRVYQARPWAFIDNPARIVHARVKEIIDEREFRDLPPADRAAVVRALVDLEVLKLEAFARQAFDDVTPDAPQDVWLAARAGIRSAADQLDIEGIVELLGEDDDETTAEAIEDQSRAFQDAAMTALRQALLETGAYGQTRLRSLFARFDFYQRYHEITEELGDDNFTIEIEMPGEIVGHNGSDRSGSTITWQFNGQLLRDRDLEVLVTSRVPS